MAIITTITLSSILIGQQTHTAIYTYNAFTATPSPTQLTMFFQSKYSQHSGVSGLYTNSTNMVFTVEFSQSDENLVVTIDSKNVRDDMSGQILFVRNVESPIVVYDYSKRGQQSTTIPGFYATATGNDPTDNGNSTTDNGHSLPTWAIITIIVVSVLILIGGAITISALVLKGKKGKK